MAGFKALDAVEELTYDFNPYADLKGVIPEPTSDQIDTYRKAVFGTVTASGVDPDEKVTAENIGALLEKVPEIEDGLLAATAEVTGLPLATLEDCPHRIKQAFMGWIAGVFLNPEA